MTTHTTHCCVSIPPMQVQVRHWQWHVMCVWQYKAHASTHLLLNWGSQVCVFAWVCEQNTCPQICQCTHETGSDMGTSFFLPANLPLGVAAELMLTGRMLGCARALQLGLVWFLCCTCVLSLCVTQTCDPKNNSIQRCCQTKQKHCKLQHPWHKTCFHAPPWGWC